MSLSLIRDYGSDSDEDSEQLMDIQEEDGTEGEEIDLDILYVVNSLVAKVERQFAKHYHFSTLNYRCQPMDEDDDSDSDSSISDVWSFSDSEDYEDEDCGIGGNRSKQVKQCVTKGEFTLDDLPPIERLQISVDVKYLTQVGIVCSMVGQLVIIQSFKNIPVLDLDTVLFCKEGTSIGQVFDVIGPVKQPNYVLRFNSPGEIQDCKLEMNSPVYYAEGHQQPITKYVFIHQLEQERGSDASWKHNNEPPPEEVDYSDDEVEKTEKWKKKAKSRRK